MVDKLPDVDTVSAWSCEDVAEWLRSVSLQECVEPFQRRNIDGKALLEIYQETFLKWTGEIRLTHQRQIAKYLNECRAKDGDRGTFASKQGFRLNLRKASLTPPPIPKQDYLGDANDNDVDSDEGWDTEFEDEPDDEVGAAQKDNSDGDSGATNEVLNLESDELQSEDNGNQVADAIRKSNAGAFSQTSQGIRSRLSHSCSDLQENVKLSQPKKRSIPRPPEHTVVPRKPFANSRSTEHLTHRLSVGRPQQQPPPPPHSSKPHIVLREETMFQANILEQHDEPMDETYFGENYEIPNSVGSQRSSSSSLSINLHMDTSGTIEEEYESLNSNLGNADSVIGEDYELVEAESGLGVKPSLPPRGHLPPPLPQKPKAKEPPKPPLPIRISKAQDESGFLPRGKSRPTLESCKNAITNLTSNLTLMFSDTRNRKQGDGSCSSMDSPQKEDQKTSPNIKESSPEVVRYVRRNPAEESSGLAHRPLPLPPPKKLQVSPENLPDQNDMDSFPWFHRVERDEAERLLKTLGKPGSYLVRESRRAGESNPYTLTILNGARMSHLNIRSRSDGTFALGTAKDNEMAFCSVEELISFHQKESILLTSKGQQTGKVKLLFHPDRR